MKAHIPSHIIACGICGEQRGTGTGLYTPSVFILILPLIEGQTGKAWESSKKAVLFQLQ
jgi:hypothetical protein